MAKLSTEDLLGQFKEMTLVELSEFVKSFETEFDVTAAAPVAAAAASRAAVPLRGAPLPPLRLLTLPRPNTAEAPRGREELLPLAIVARDGI